jgi:alanine racemase
MDSTSSDRLEDLDAVARRERVGAEAGTGNHVAVDGYGDASAFEVQRLDELLDGAAGRNIAGLAIDEKSKLCVAHGRSTRHWHPLQATGGVAPVSNGRCESPLIFDNLAYQVRDAEEFIERPTLAAIHLDAVRANFAEARRCAEGRSIIAVVKADAYGHGAAPVARTLAEAGCERLAVLSVEEGCELREAGLEPPILVLGGVHGDCELALERGLTPVLHHAGHLERVAKLARRRGERVSVHVEVDTGMRRMGVPPGEAEALLARVAAEPALWLEGVYTHLARADEPELAPSFEQLAAFRRVLLAARARGIAPPLVHCANSPGLLVGRRLFEALPEANAVRPGLMLYGVLPAPHLEARLRPAMTLRTGVAHVRRLRAGEAVGYAALFRAQQPTRVATLPLGYADGVPVAASNRGSVMIDGRIGDEAILFGEGAAGRLPVEEAAEAAHTISYELLVRVGTRVPRVVEG